MLAPNSTVDDGVVDWDPHGKELDIEVPNAELPIVVAVSDPHSAVFIDEQGVYQSWGEELLSAGVSPGGLVLLFPDSCHFSELIIHHHDVAAGQS